MITPTPKKFYRIQVGAFPVKANVDALLAKVKAVGFNIANKEHKTRDCDYSLSWVFFAFRGQRFAMFPHTSAKLTAFIDAMKQNRRPLHSFNRVLWSVVVEKIIIYPYGRIGFTLIDSTWI